MLRIEVDGHFHGRPPEKPWVARITGPDEKYGLVREFVRPLNDWSDARRAWSGNVYGVVSAFPLREGHLYEVKRTEGKPSKRHVVRQFYWLEASKLTEIGPEAALQRIAGGAAGAAFRTREFPGRTRVTDLIEPEPVGFVVRGTERVYWLRDGREYDVRDVDRRGQDRCRLVRVHAGQLDIESVRRWPEQTIGS